MYARASTFTGNAEDFDRGAERIQSELLPRLKEVPGYKGLLSLVDRSAGQSLSITLWDSEEAMSRSREVAKQLRSQVAALAGGEIVSVTEYEVNFADLPSN